MIKIATRTMSWAEVSSWEINRVPPSYSWMAAEPVSIAIIACGRKRRSGQAVAKWTEGLDQGYKKFELWKTLDDPIDKNQCLFEKDYNESMTLLAMMPRGYPLLRVKAHTRVFP